MTAHGHFHWNELMTRDTERAKAFFGKTVGWTFDEMKMDGRPAYWVAMDGDQPVGGIFDITDKRFEGVPEAWMSYIAVDDVDRRIEMAGAKAPGSCRSPSTFQGRPHRHRRRSRRRHARLDDAGARCSPAIEANPCRPG